MAVLAPGASHRPGGRALPPAPLPRAGFSRRPSLRPLIPRPLSRGAGQPGVAVRVSGQWLAGCGAAGSPPRSLSPPSLPREVARCHTWCRTVGPVRARGLGGGATARVNGGGQRAHHPSDRSVSKREGGGEWGGPSGPLAPPSDGRGGGRHGGPGPRGQPSAGGSHPPPTPLYLEPDPRAGPRWGPLSPPPSSRGAGRLGAAVRVSGQRLAGCRAVGSPPRSLSLPSLPREVARAPSSRRTVGGAWVGGPSPPPPTLPYPPSGSSPAPPLVWGLGLRRRRVVPAVAPVGEGAAQSPGEPVVGVRIRDAEHRSPFQEGRPRRLSVGPRRPDH